MIQSIDSETVFDFFYMYKKNSRLATIGGIGDIPGEMRPLHYGI